MSYERLKDFTSDVITFLLTQLEAQGFLEYLEQQGYTDDELSEFSLGPV